MQGYNSQAARIDKFKGAIIGHAVPQECLSKGGDQISFPKNSSQTYIARRWVPYGATASNPNSFFATTTAIDRGNAIVQAHQAAEGITATPDNIIAVDYTCVMQQYECLYGFTDKTFDLYEDDVPAAMVEQVGERVLLVGELLNFGTLKATTFQYYGGTGTSRANTNGPLTLSLQRKMIKAMKAAHGTPVTRMLAATLKYGTDPVEAGYFAYCSTDMEPDIRDLPGFIPTSKYASGTPIANEIGKVEAVRYVLSPEFVPILDGGGPLAATGLASNLGTSIDLYQFFIVGAHAWAQVSVRGLENLDPTFLPPNKKDKSDPQGKRGYAGTTWWKGVFLQNPGWCLCGNVGIKAL
jgi:N4-gp56 family major capsid protein